MRRFCLILFGSGHLDGSEIHEATYSLLALAKMGVEVDIFAPDRMQMHALNHYTKEDENYNRNILNESARIARGNIRPLKDLDIQRYAGLVIPGGFGVLKNNSNFPSELSEMIINTELEQIVKAFHEAKKVICAICIVPSILALIFKDKNVTLCTGLAPNYLKELEFTNNNIIAISSSDCIIDNDNKLITTPAFMNDAPFNVVYEGIEKAISEMIKLS